MLRRTFVIVCITVFFGTVAFAACRPPQDPGDDDNGGTTNGTSTASDATGGGTMDATGGSGTMDATGGSGTMDATTGGGTDGGGTTADGGTGGCSRPDTEDVHKGGTPTTDPFTHDAGLVGIIDAIKQIRSDNGGSWPMKAGGDAGNTEPKSVELSGGDQVEITDAVVTATSFKGDSFDAGQSEFWLQDSKQVVHAYLDEAIECPKLRVGDRVSFTATGVKLYPPGYPELTGVSNFRRNENADETVSFQKMTGKTLEPRHYGQIVKIGGELTKKKSTCDAADHCFTLTHGSETIEYRIDGSSPPSVGDCVTFVGPAGMYPGPLATGSKKMQLEATNFSWVYSGQPMGGDAGMSGSCETLEFFNGQIHKPKGRN